jgi:EAL domain-containing protein (putative c-di-GMP-specific phosphodiesterase class I)
VLNPASLPSSERKGGRILLIDDEPALLASLSLVLGRAGHEVSTVEDGQAGVERLAVMPVDAVLCDIRLPRLSGIGFLRRVRELGLEIPVVLMTGAPDLETAIPAIELGAMHYLPKPVETKEVLRVMAGAVRMGQLGRLARQASAVRGEAEATLERLEARFSRALATIRPAFQPIVAWQSRTVYAYEALLRCSEPTLPGPHEVIAAAERLGRIRELGRVMRHRTAAAAHALPSSALLFVNLHPLDLLDDELYRPDTALAALAPRVVFEIAERASLDGVPDVPGRAARLRSLGYRVAVDDLGIGYAGLSSLILLEPQIVKVDMSLVRGVDVDPVRQQVIRSITHLCSEMGMAVVCEGVQAPAERDTLRACGCDLLQGYLFGRPAFDFQSAQF